MAYIVLRDTLTMESTSGSLSSLSAGVSGNATNILPPCTISCGVLTSFEIAADVGEILSLRGPGVYQVLVWGTVNGKPAVIADYHIFHEVPTPTGYIGE